MNTRFLAQVRAQRLVNLRGAALLAIEAVAGNMRRGQHAQVSQVDVHLGLAFPHVQHRLQVFARQQHLAQRGVIHHRTPAGVDQPGARLELCQALAIKQVPGRTVAGLDQRRMQADHVTLLDDLLQADVITALGNLARRIAHQHIPTQALEHLDQAPADFTRADDAVGTLLEVSAFDFSQGLQAAKHVVHHPTRIAAGRAGPLDTRLLEVVEVQVVGADGAGADKAHVTALKQGTVDVGHRAHQQYIGLLDGGAVDGTAGHAANLAKPFEECIEQRDIFVGNNQHGRLLWRIGSVQKILCRSWLACDCIDPVCLMYRGACIAGKPAPTGFSAGLGALLTNP